MNSELAGPAINSETNRLSGAFALNHLDEKPVRILRHQRDEVELGDVPAAGHNAPAQRFHLRLDRRRVGDVPSQMMSVPRIPNTSIPRLLDTSIPSVPRTSTLSIVTHHTPRLVVLDEFQQHLGPARKVLQGVIRKSHLMKDIEP